eukprot:286816_1
MSGVLTERKISETQHTVHEHKQNDNIKSKRRRRRKGSKRKWSAQNVLSAKKYHKYCDEFDAMNNFEIGCSRKYFIVGAKMTDNIFCYILQQYHIKSDYIAFDHEDGSIGKLLEIIEQKNVTKLIAFNSEHAWCYIQVDHVWYEFDSLQKRTKPKPI